MSEVNPNYNPQDPFGNRWEEHPAAVENQLKDEPTVKYGLTATEILKTEYPHIYNGYMDIMEEQLELFSRKMLDYGLGNIALGGDLENKEDLRLAMTSIWIRCNDKMNRQKNMVVKGNKSFVDESVVDTYQDLVNYNIIAQLVLQGNWKK